MKDQKNKRIIKPPKSDHHKTKTACPELFEALGAQKIKLYRGIFKNNSKKSRSQFFADPLIGKIWPFIRENMEYDDLFFKADPNESIMVTYHAITQEIKEKYDH